MRQHVPLDQWQQAKRAGTIIQEQYENISTGDLANLNNLP
jgi:hypothetical protein